MRIDLAFGVHGLHIELPAGFRYHVLERPLPPDPCPDPDRAIAAALDAPIGSPSLIDLARGKNSAAISVCDITRPAPNRVVLPHVLERLQSAGIPPDRTTILIATGPRGPPARKRSAGSAAGRCSPVAIRMVVPSAVPSALLQHVRTRLGASRVISQTEMGQHYFFRAPGR